MWKDYGKIALKDLVGTGADGKIWAYITDNINTNLKEIGWERVERLKWLGTRKLVGCSEFRKMGEGDFLTS